MRKWSCGADVSAKVLSMTTKQDNSKGSNKNNNNHPEKCELPPKSCLTKANHVLLLIQVTAARLVNQLTTGIMHVHAPYQFRSVNSKTNTVLQGDWRAK